MFVITGPGSPSALVNMIVGIEHHVDWIAECLVYLRDKEIDRIDVEPEAEDQWVAHVNESADKTLFVKANSWYLGANVPGKPRVFMLYTGGLKKYREICDDVAKAQYRGFQLSQTTQRKRAL